MKTSLEGRLLCVWSAVSVDENRKVKEGERDFAFLPGLHPLWEEEWSRVPHTTVCEDDVLVWPSCLNFLFFGFLVLAF